MSYNFVNGRHNYTTELATNGHYPAQVAAINGWKIINDPHKDYFTLGGVRTTDIFAQLSDNFYGDGYTRIMHGIDETFDDRAGAIAYIKNADVISIQLGHSSISTYGLTELMHSLTGIDFTGEDVTEGYGHNLNDIFTAEEISRTKPIVQQCIQGITLEYSKCKLIEKMSPILDDFIDTISYILISDMVHFDGMMKEILENKKEDAEIYVLGLFNPIKDFKLNYTINGRTITIQVADILDAMFNVINEYYRVYSEYSTRYYYVAPTQNVETYGDLLANGDNEKADSVATDFLVALLNNGDLEGTKEADRIAVQQYVPLIRKLASVNTVNLNELIDALDNFDDSSLNFESIVSKISINQDGELVATEIDKVLGYAFIFTMLQGVYVHPTQQGHNAIAQNLLNAMKNPTVDAGAIIYHRANSMIKIAIAKSYEKIQSGYEALWQSAQNRKNKLEKAYNAFSSKMFSYIR